MARRGRRTRRAKKTGGTIIYNTKRIVGAGRPSGANGGRGAYRSNVYNRPMASIGKGFPQKLMITHKYADNFELTASLGALGSIFWSVNSLHQPRVGGGHQPMMYDQLLGIYRHYTVIGSKISFRCSPDATNAVQANLATYIDDNASIAVATSITSIVEQSNKGKVRIMPMPTAAPGPIIFGQKWSAKKAFGGSVLSDPNLQGSSGASPSEQQYFVLSAQSFNEQSGIKVQGIVTIEYITMWQELQDTTAS